MKSKRCNWLKSLLQWGTLAAIVGFILWGVFGGGKPADPEAYCPFGGLQATGSYLVNTSLTCSMSLVQIMMGIVLAVGVILFSKLFCGYLCPLGTVEEYLGRAGKKAKCLYTIPQGSIADKALRILKYVLLFIVFYYSVKSSELFCKNFDPYYAAATGFKGEITAWMAWLAIAVMILGGFFVKMFWCKYICPLGAISNLFRFTLLFAAVAVLIWVLGIAGVANGWIWALGVACIASYIFEITCLKKKTWSLLRIVRDEATCTNCGLCAKKCPYAIDVDKTKKVTDVDCTLCGECVTCCPVDALAVSKKKSLRWVPGLLVIVLFVLAIIMGRTWELPTIDMKWGEWQKVENMKTFEMEGLTSVKCFGSSRAFASKMEKVPGVYGVKTYVGRFAVVLSYDPAVTDTLKIQESIFTPTKMKFKSPKADSDSLRIVQLGVDGLFDRMDMVYLGNILRKFDGVYGFEANFACPVDVKLYTDPAITLDKEVLKDSIQAKETAMMAHGGAVKTIHIHYKLASYIPDAGMMSARDFVNLMFEENRALSGEFKDNTEKYGDDAAYPKAVYELVYPGIEKPLIKRSFPYFKSFLSTSDGITRIDVELNDALVPVLRITYVKSMWDDKRIWDEICQAPVWKIKYKDGSIKEEEAKLTFDTEGHTIQ